MHQRIRRFTPIAVLVVMISGWIFFAPNQFAATDGGSPAILGLEIFPWPVHLKSNTYRHRHRAKRLENHVKSSKPRIAGGSQTSQRYRVLVSTDIGGTDPDDFQSMVHFLLYADRFDIEGLISSPFGPGRKKHILEVVDHYERDYANLKTYSTRYPTPQALRAITKEGALESPGAEGIGKPTEGSQWIVRSARRKDARPLHVLVWGGPNCLAQALWKVRITRAPEDVEKFVAKLRVYTISDQDDSGPWLRKTFPNLFYIASPGVHSGGAYHHATWSAISGDNFHGRFAGADFSIVDNLWLDRHVRSKGPLGAQYPITKFLMEGDTPSFLYLINNGLGDSEHPDWGSWGGRYEFYTPRMQKWLLEPESRAFWTNAEDEVLGVDGKWHTSNKATIWRWRSAYQNDFAARMDWTIKPFTEANHPPVAKLNHSNRLSAKSGERVNLSAEGSTDPDGNPLSYELIYYGEPGTFVLSTARTGAPLKIEDASKSNAWFTAPKVTKPATMHVILAVTDHGTPALTRYQRVIITLYP